MNILGMLIPFSIAVLSGLGVGSGGLLVIYLTLIEGLPQLRAQGINLVFFLFSAGASMLVHLRRRRLLPTLCILLILGGIPGTLAGSFLAVSLPGTLLRQIFGGFLIVAGTLTLTRSDKIRALFGKFHKSLNINR